MPEMAAQKAVKALS